MLNPSFDSASGLHKIPLTVGFANLSGTDLDALLAEDAKMLSPLFAQLAVVATHEIPKTPILFVYMHLNEDGTIKGSPGSGIRQIVQMTNAAIIILASPNSAGCIKNAVALPGPKTANMVFTVSRNGNSFSEFFYNLFAAMRDGENMLGAWAKLAPQVPQANSSITPDTLFAAEGGKIAFPK